MKINKLVYVKQAKYLGVIVCKPYTIHPGMDGLDTGRRHEESGETRGVEGAGCQVICGAPTVH